MTILACKTNRCNNEVTMADVMNPEQRSRCMAAIKGKDTKPEMNVQKYLFSQGLLYRVNNRKLPGSSDIVFKKYKTVVFIDVCFWHGHERCKYFRLPKTNVDFWRHKIAMNIARDYANNVDLHLAGWKVIRIWECDIKKKAKREGNLEWRYLEIVGLKCQPCTSEPLPYDSNIAAEPNFHTEIIKKLSQPG